MEIQPQKEELLFEAGEGDRNIFNGKSSLGIFFTSKNVYGLCNCVVCWIYCCVMYS